MTTPAECAGKFPDDASIGADAQLLRRIPPWHIVATHDPAQGVRISSAAFEDDKDGSPMSVFRLNVIEAEGGKASRVLKGHEGFALAALSAGFLRSRQQTVYPNPLPCENSHALVCGPKTKATQRSFARHAEWVIPPSR